MLRKWRKKKVGERMKGKREARRKGEKEAGTAKRKRKESKREIIEES